MNSQGDILLLPFPFSDLSGKKVRPVLVLSGKNYNNSSEDIVVCALTSQIKLTDYSIIIDNKDLKTGKLFQQSCVKIDSLFKISSKLVIKKIGSLQRTKLNNILTILRIIFQ